MYRCEIGAREGRKRRCSAGRKERREEMHCTRGWKCGRPGHTEPKRDAKPLNDQRYVGGRIERRMAEPMLCVSNDRGMIGIETNHADDDAATASSCLPASMIVALGLQACLSRLLSPRAGILILKNSLVLLEYMRIDDSNVTTLSFHNGSVRAFWNNVFHNGDNGEGISMR